MTHITLCITDAGGGHRASAEALISHFNDSKQYRFTILNIYTQVFKNKDEDVYNNLILKKGWSIIYWPIIVPLFRFKIWALQVLFKNKLKKYWQANPTDQVISLLPFFNQILRDSVKETTDVPFKILSTDFTEPCKNYWLVDQDITAYFFPSDDFKPKLKQPNNSKVIENKGVILKSKYYHESTGNFDFETNPEKPLGLLLLGGYGSMEIFKYLQSIDDLDVQLIVICGHNKNLLKKIKNQKWKSNIIPIGFTNKIAEYMEKADYLIGKPGPGSVQEALVKQLPILVLSNYKTMKQEEPVADYILKNKLGYAFTGTSDFKNKFIIFSKYLKQYQQNVQALEIENPKEKLRLFLEA